MSVTAESVQHIHCHVATRHPILVQLNSCNGFGREVIGAHSTGLKNYIINQWLKPPRDL